MCPPGKNCSIASLIPEALHDTVAALAALEEARSTLSTAQARHERAHNTAREAAEAFKTAETALKLTTDDHALVQAHSTECNRAFTDKCVALAFDSAGYIRAKSDVAQVSALSKAVQDFNQRLKSVTDRFDRATAETKDLTRPDLSKTEAEAQAAADSAQAADRAMHTVEASIADCTRTRVQIFERASLLKNAEDRFAVVGELSRLADGNNDARLRLVDYAIAATFEDVLVAANTRFNRISQGRFTLMRKTTSSDGRARGGLEIAVHDTHTEQPRDAQTLSGGEGFVAALSLALGLSDVVQAESGGVKLDVIFIDEGFGHLDDQSLDAALCTLRDLVGRDRAVGIISHVEAVKQQIPGGFEVTSGLRGSAIQTRGLT